MTMTMTTTTSTQYRRQNQPSAVDSSFLTPLMWLNGSDYQKSIEQIRPKHARFLGCHRKLRPSSARNWTGKRHCHGYAGIPPVNQAVNIHKRGRGAPIPRVAILQITFNFYITRAAIHQHEAWRGFVPWQAQLEGRQPVERGTRWKYGNETGQF